MAATVTAAPLRDALVAILNDAICWRTPESYGCRDCARSTGRCADHQADHERAEAVTQVRDLAFYARSDDEAVEILRGQAALLALIAGGARDDG
jgi:hypothetical protein